MYNGMFHPLSPENRWKPPATGAASSLNPIGPAEAMHATDDPYFNTYIVSNAWDASRSIGQPYDEDDVSVKLAEHFHAVLDYTLVQPETGGALRPARLSYDRKMILGGLGGVEREQLKYLRTRWGEGNLYHCGFSPSPNIGVYTDPYGEAVPSTVSFSFISMRNYSPNHAHAWPTGLVLTPEARIILPFYYFDEPGGYSFDAKKFPKIWVHAAFPRLDALSQPNNSWKVEIIAGPDSRFWNRKEDVQQFIDAGPGDTWRYNSPFHEISPALNNFGGYAADNLDHVLGDILEATLPTSLQGRGLWIDIHGGAEWMWFAGFGGYWIPGAISQPFVVAPDE
jgi:hypothetical protein